MTIRIILADDHNVIRSGLRTLLEQQCNAEVVAEASDGRKAVQLTKELSPDIVIMDIGMAEMNGIEATRKITSDQSHVKVLALSMHSDKRFVLTMLKAGASGYLIKNCAVKELKHALNVIMDNHTYLSPSITGLVLDELVTNQENVAILNSPTLTAREREVLQLLAEGKSTKEIASELKVSISTVETHRRQIMEKLDLFSVAELTKYAIREGLTSLE